MKIAVQEFAKDEKLEWGETIFFSGGSAVCQPGSSSPTIEKFCGNFFSVATIQTANGQVCGEREKIGCT